MPAERKVFLVDLCTAHKALTQDARSFLGCLQEMSSGGQPLLFHVGDVRKFVAMRDALRNRGVNAPMVFSDRVESSQLSVWRLLRMMRRVWRSPGTSIVTDNRELAEAVAKKGLVSHLLWPDAKTIGTTPRPWLTEHASAADLTHHLAKTATVGGSSAAATRKP